MKLVMLILVGTLALSCGTKKNAKKNGKMNVITATIADQEMDQKSDDYTINSIEIKGNVMTLDVSYSGGCTEHSFAMTGSQVISKSLPPIRSIQLIHNANGETCRELKSTKVSVNIESLAYKQEEGSEIYLTLNGWKDRILYKYDTGTDK